MTKNAPLLPIEEQMMFWQEHSTAITQFAHVERSLAELTAAGVERTASKALLTAFFGIEAFRSKLEFADRFVRVRLEGEHKLLNAWDIVQGRCKKAAEGRNKLVHWQVVTHTGGVPGHRVVLLPPALNPSSKHALESEAHPSTTPPPYAIGIRQLVEIRYGFFETMLAVERFRATAAGAPDPYPLLTPPKASTLSKLVADFRGTFGRFTGHA